MALENVGLGGVLKFDGSQAITGMGAAAAATDRLKGSQTALRSSSVNLAQALSQMGAAATRVGLAAAPMSAAVGFGIKQAADFERQVSAVAAITRATEADMSRLESKAKEMGATTVFSATQSAEAMENMGRAGANVDEIIDGLSGVMAAAAADSIDLATSADIVARVVRGMGLEFNQANRVADVLAMTSASSNTTIIDLGESFKYAGAQARNLNIDLETTSALLGAAADAGLRGSIGGTSFTNMLIKLTKPSEKANKWLKANNIEMTKTADGGLDVVDVIRQISAALSGETDVLNKAALATELFGIRGQKAFSAVEASMASGRFDELLKKVQDSSGAAAEMAAKRLDNLHGQIVLLKSALEGFAIETAGAFLGPMSAAVEVWAKGLGNVVAVLQALQGATVNLSALEEKHGRTAVAVALGIADAINSVVSAWGAVRSAVAGFIRTVSGSASPTLIRTLAKWATLFVLTAAAVAPILLAFGGVVAVIGAILPVIKIVAIAVGGLATGFLQIGLIVGAVFLFMRKDGESFGGFMLRMFKAIWGAVLWFKDTAIMPLVNAFKNAVMPAVQATKARFQNFVAEGRKDFQQLIGGVIRAVKMLAPVFKAVFNVIGNVIAFFARTAMGLFRGITHVAGGLLGVIKEIAIFIIEGLVNGLQTFVGLAVKAADALGISDGSAMWAELAFFASQPKLNLTDAMGGSAGRLASMEAAQGIGSAEIKEEPEEFMPNLAKEVADVFANNKAAAAGPSEVQVDVELEDNRKLDINNCVSIDGREVAIAQARHKQEINERAGFRATPWQRRAILEHGAAPVGGLGGGS